MSAQLVHQLRAGSGGWWAPGAPAEGTSLLCRVPAGDPLYDFVMLHVSVLRSRADLLRACLGRYGAGAHPQFQGPPTAAPLSYRAM